MSTERTSGAGTADAAVIDEALADDAVALVRRWLAASRAEPVDPAAGRLAGVLRDPNGLAFTVGFVDGVIRPEDPRAAARHLASLVPITPRFLPWPLRAAIRAGAVVGRVLPGVVVPIAQASLRRTLLCVVNPSGPDGAAGGVGFDAGSQVLGAIVAVSVRWSWRAM